MSELAAEWDQHCHWSKEERGSCSREGVQLSDNLVTGGQGLGGAPDWLEAEPCPPEERQSETFCWMSPCLLGGL